MALGWAVSGVRVCAPILCGTCNGVGLLSAGVRNRAINFLPWGRAWLVGRHSEKLESSALFDLVEFLKGLSEVFDEFHVGWELAEAASAVAEEFARLEGENAGLRDELARRPPVYPATIINPVPNRLPYVTFNNATSATMRNSDELTRL